MRLSVHSRASFLAARVTSSDAAAICLAQSIKSFLLPPSPLQEKTFSLGGGQRRLLLKEVCHWQALTAPTDSIVPSAWPSAWPRRSARCPCWTIDECPGASRKLPPRSAGCPAASESQSHPHRRSQTRTDGRTAAADAVVHRYVVAEAVEAQLKPSIE